DHANLLALQVRIGAGPGRGVVHLSGEIGQPGNARSVHRRQTTRRAQQKPPANGVPRRRLYYPLPRLEPRADRVGREPVVPRQIEPVRHMIQIRQDLGLRRETLRPRPAALQVIVERVGIVHTFDIAACARIAVPVPRASDARGRLHAEHRQTFRDTTMYGVQPGEAGTDHDRIETHASSPRMSDHSNSRAEAPAANGMIVTKPWNSPGNRDAPQALSPRATAERTQRPRCAARRTRRSRRPLAAGPRAIRPVPARRDTRARVSSRSGIAANTTA